MIANLRVGELVAGPLHLSTRKALPSSQLPEFREKALISPSSLFLYSRQGSRGVLVKLVKLVKLVNTYLIPSSIVHLLLCSFLNLPCPSTSILLSSPPIASLCPHHQLCASLYQLSGSPAFITSCSIIRLFACLLTHLFLPRPF